MVVDATQRHHFQRVQGHFQALFCSVIPRLPGVESKQEVEVDWLRKFGGFAEPSHIRVVALDQLSEAGLGHSLAETGSVTWTPEANVVRIVTFLPVWRTDLV